MADTIIDPPDARASSSTVTARSSSRSSTKLLTRLFELPMGTRLVAPGVSWAFYEEYISKIPENSPVRTAFDGRDLETMTLGYAHEVFEDLIGYLVTAIAEDLEIS